MLDLPLVKTHCRIDFDDDDGYLDAVTIPGAVALWEAKAGRTFDDAEPAALSSVLRIAAALYERRESVDPESLAAVPGWVDDLLVDAWSARV